MTLYAPWLTYLAIDQDIDAIHDLVKENPDMDLATQFVNCDPPVASIYAAYEGKPAVLSVLLTEFKADPNLLDPGYQKMSALHFITLGIERFASYLEDKEEGKRRLADYQECIKLLTTAKADPHLKSQCHEHCVVNASSR